MNDFPLEKHGIINYTNFSEIEELAEIYAEKRMEANAKLHESAPEYSRGLQGKEVDVLGIQAELIAVELFKQKNILHTPLKIYEPAPVSEPDTSINEFNVDIKGVKTTLDELRVNCESHYKKNSTHYLFIKPYKDENGKLNGVAEYWVVSALYASFWERKQSYTEYFYKKITEINKIIDDEK